MINLRIYLEHRQTEQLWNSMENSPKACSDLFRGDQDPGKQHHGAPRNEVCTAASGQGSNTGSPETTIYHFRFNANRLQKIVLVREISRSILEGLVWDCHFWNYTIVLLNFYRPKASTG